MWLKKDVPFTYIIIFKFKYLLYISHIYTSLKYIFFFKAIILKDIKQYTPNTEGERMVRHGNGFEGGDPCPEGRIGGHLP